MNSFRSGSLCNRFIAFVVAFFVGIQPVFGQIVAYKGVKGNQQPTVLRSNNGVPIVNIQTPGSDGVSRNVYEQFDVGTEGAVLNNSRKGAGTVLAGGIGGNPWLAKGTAKVILNEIISSNPSQLLGLIEVGGDRAEVVIANPAGIYANGAGFINATHAVLTTGKPIWTATGRLEGYDVRDGRIVIGERGLDASGADYTSILTRALEIGGELRANELTMRLGSYRANVAGEIVAGTTDATPAMGTPPTTYALDVSALGGMYTGKITLLGTEAGLGVRNAGEIYAVTDSITLTADGKLLNEGVIAAKGNVAITTGDIDSTETSSLIAGMSEDGESADLLLNARDKLKASGRNQASGAIRMTGSQIDLADSKTRALEIQLNARDQAKGSARGQIKTDRAEIVAREIGLRAKALSNVGGMLQQTGDKDWQIDLDGTLDNREGRIISASKMYLQALELFNDGGVVSSGEAIVMQVARDLANGTGLIHGPQVDVTVGGQLDNAEGGLISGKVDVAKDIKNSGAITGFARTGGALDNRGFIGDGAAAKTSIKNKGNIVGTASAGTDLRNKGAIGGSASAKDTLSNQGTIIGTAKAGTDLRNKGSIGGSATAGNDLNNQGSIGDSAAAGNNLNNQGMIGGSATAGNDLNNSGYIGSSASAGAFLANAGAIGGSASAGAALSNNGSIGGTARAGTALANSGTIGGSATAGTSLDNRGFIGGSASAGSTLNNAGAIGGSATAGTTLGNSGSIGGSATAGDSLNNSGSIGGSATAGTSLSNSGFIGETATAGTDLRNSGAIAGSATAGGSLKNKGEIGGSATAGTFLDNSGFIGETASAGTDLRNKGAIVGSATAEGSLNNKGEIGGTASAGSTLANSGFIGETATAGTALTNSGTIIESATAGTALANTGAIGGSASAGEDLTSSGFIGGSATAGTTLANTGAIGGSASAGGDLTSSGSIGGSAAAGNSLDNRGTIGGSASATKNLTSSGSIGGSASAGNTLNNRGAIGGSAFATGSLSNSGAIGGSASAGGSLSSSGSIGGSASATGSLSNSGSIGGSASAGGSLSSSGAIGGSAYATGSLNNSGYVGGSASAGGSLSSSGSIGGSATAGGSLGNSGTIGGSASAGGDLTSSGVIRSSATAGGALNNSGAISDSVTVAGALNNEGTIIGSVTTGGSLDNQGEIGGSATAGSSLDNSGTIKGSASAKRELANSGTISGSATAGGFLDNQGTIGGSANAGTSLNNAGNIGGSANARQDLTNLGTIGGSAGAGGVLDNSGAIGTKGGNINVTARTVQNSGTIGTANANVWVNAGTVNNQNGLMEGRNLTVTAANLNNQEGILRAGAALTISALTTLNNQGGQIVSGNILSIHDLSAGPQKALSILNTDGLIKADKTLNLEGKSVSYDGKIQSGGDFAARLEGDYTHNGQGFWEAKGLVSLHFSGTITNTGLWGADGGLQLSGSAIHNTEEGVISSPGAISLEAREGDLTNRGGILGESVLLNAKGNLDNSGGLILASGNATLTAGNDLSNQKGWIEAGAVSLEAKEGKLDNSGGAIIGGNVVATAGGNIGNDGGVILATGKATLMSGNDLSNQDGRIEAGSVTAIALNNLSGGGDKAALTARDGNLLLSAGNDLNYQGSELNAQGNLSLFAGNDLTLAGTKASAGGDLTAWADGKLQILATKTEEKSSLNYYTNQTQTNWQVSDLKAEGNLALISGGDMKLEATKLTSGGDMGLSSGGHMDWAGVEDKKVQEAKKPLLAFNVLPENNTTWQTVEFDAGGKFEATSGGKLTAQGGNLKAEKDVVILAKEGMTFESVTDKQENTSQNQNATRDLSRLLAGDSSPAKQYTNPNASSDWPQSQLLRTETTSQTERGFTADSAGGNMTFVSGGDLKMTAAVLSSKENLTAVAEGNIVLQAGQSTETTKIGAAPTLLSHLQKEQAGYASSHESVTGNTLTAGGNVTLAAKGGDLTLVSGKVTAEGDIALAASGKVAVTGMVTKDSTRDAEWRINYNGDSPQTTKLNETGSEKFNWTGSALSGDNLSIQSGKDTIFVGSDAKMRGGVLIDAKGDIIFGPMDAKGELFGSMDAKGNIFGSAVEHKIEKPQNGVLFLFGATSTNESTVWRESRIEAGGGITALADGKFILNAGQITTPGAVWIDAKEGVQIGSLLSIEQQNLPFKLTKQSFALAEARIEGSNIAIKSGADMNLVAAKIGGSGDVRLDAQGNITAESLMSGTSNPSNRDLKAQTTELRAEGNLTVKSAGGDIRATGLEAHAGKDLSLSAAGDIKLMSVVDEAYRVKEKSSGGFFSKTTTETWSDETVRGAQLTSGGRMELKAGNELELEAANLKGKEGITLDANKIILSMADEKHFYSKVKDNDYMGVWQSNANKGSTQVVGVETVLESEGPIKINARENLVVEYAQRKGESAEDAQARAFAKTDLWQIETNNPTGSPLILTGKADGLNTWSTSHQGLGTVGAMIVAVVVTMVTYGAASAMVGSAAGATAGSGSAMAAAGTTAGSAGAGWANVALASGMSSMASSAAVQLGTNGKLDWNQIGKSGLSATLTAGILNYPGLADGQSLNDMAGFGQNSSGTTQAKNGLFTGEFTSDKAIGLAGRSVVQATVEKTLFGTNFKDGFVNALVSDLAANVAYDIGSTWGTGDTKNPAAHMLAHAGLGATAAKLTGKDPVAGALGGLTAGIIENVIPEGSINPNNLSDRIQVIAGSSLASGIIANMLGKDENVAMGATKNAIENNYLSPKQLMQVEQAMADCKGNPLCEQQVKQSAQALSASQDLELSWAKFLCQFSVCADRNNREGVIEASFDPARFIPEIQAAHPGWSLDQVQNEATRYLTEAQNSLDASTWRTVFGTLDVASAVAVAIAPLAAGAANVPKTGAGVVSEVPQIALNRQSGAAFESQVIEAFGHVGGVKNTAPVTVQLPNGAQVTTIPDLWGKNVGGLLEVKNVQNLSMSNQLRAQIKVASDTGQPLNLVVSPRTNNVSAELMRQVRSTGGDVYRYNPITGDLTRF